jgi:putative ribosome biogenesis GTPase RsgA
MKHQEHFSRVAAIDNMKIGGLIENQVLLLRISSNTPIKLHLLYKYLVINIEKSIYFILKLTQFNLFQDFNVSREFHDFCYHYKKNVVPNTLLFTKF